MTSKTSSRPVDVGAILARQYEFEQRLKASDFDDRSGAWENYKNWITVTWPDVIEVLRRLRRVDLAAPATSVNDALWLSTCAQYEAGDDVE